MKKHKEQNPNDFQGRNERSNQPTGKMQAGKDPNKLSADKLGQNKVQKSAGIEGRHQDDRKNALPDQKALKQDPNKNPGRGQLQGRSQSDIRNESKAKDIRKSGNTEYDEDESIAKKRNEKGQRRD